jgi:hypothetical protein
MSDTFPNTPLSPDEEPTAEEIAEAGRMRQLEELPSPWTVKGNPPMIAEPTLGALSPEDRKAVIERAAGSRDPDALNVALRDFLRERSAEFRLKAGAGEGATATEREALEQMNQLRLLGEELGRIERELAEVREHRTELDANGNPVAVPVYSLQGDGRTGREARAEEIKHQMALVAGVQGEAALQRAAREDAIRARELRTAAYVASETKRRAQELALEERINAAARTRAKFLKGSD